MDPRTPQNFSLKRNSLSMKPMFPYRSNSATWSDFISLLYQQTESAQRRRPPKARPAAEKFPRTMRRMQLGTAKEKQVIKVSNDVGPSNPTVALSAVLPAPVKS